jgi:hypothetical protein
MSMKNSSDTIGNRSRDLPACNAVPQPTAPPTQCSIKYNTTVLTCILRFVVYCIGFIVVYNSVGTRSK